MIGSVLSAGALPSGWVVTLPKVTSTAQVSAMVALSGRLERVYGLDHGALTFEMHVETPLAIMLRDGTAGVAPMLHAAEARCTGLHFGTYDYTAALGIAGGFQAMDHPAADRAKLVMQLAAAGTGIRVSDGSTNIVPVALGITPPTVIPGVTQAPIDNTVHAPSQLHTPSLRPLSDGTLWPRTCCWSTGPSRCSPAYRR